MIDHRSYTNNLSSCEIKSQVYYELTMWPAPSGLDSSVDRALHGTAEVIGSNPVQALISQLLKFCV